MQRTSIIFLGGAVASLTGCTAVEGLSGRISEQMRAAEQNRQQAQMETARKRCLDYGYEPGNETFAACVQKEFTDLSAARSAVTVGSVNIGSGMASSPAGCTLYEHVNYGGGAYRLRPNSVVNALPGFNDRASSARVSGSCTLELYEHDDHRGERRILRQDTSEFGHGWNDRVSSAKCWCR